jgi:hypothetical protein
MRGRGEVREHNNRKKASQLSRVAAKPAKRITADSLRRYWVFQPPTQSELAEVERLQQQEREQQEMKRA